MMNGRALRTLAIGLAVGLALAGTASAELEGSQGLEGAGRLNGGSRRPAARPSVWRRVELQGARTGLRERGRGNVAGAAVAAGRRVGSARAASNLSRAVLQGAASSLPESQLGRLWFDVARELEGMEEDMIDVAIGYYMAVLADPNAANRDEARRRLNDLLLDPRRPVEEAMRLYDEGLEVLESLVRHQSGLSREGVQAGRRVLARIKFRLEEERARSAAKEDALESDQGRHD